MTLSTAQRIGILLILALVMLVTRINHFAPLPDASWAVFFVAGFYLRRQLLWVFPLLLAEAVLIDYWVITSQGTGFWQHYCMSPAYWVLLAAYAVMCAGGVVLARLYRSLDVRALVLFVVTGFIAINLFYLISNGSFYWLSDSVPLPRSLAAWGQNLADWYVPYLRTNAVYLGLAAAMHALVVLMTQGMTHSSDQKIRRQGG